MLTEEEKKEINKLKEIWGECQGYGKVHLKRRYNAICKLEEYEKEYWYLKNKYNLLEKDNVALIRHNRKQKEVIDKLEKKIKVIKQYDFDKDGRYELLDILKKVSE